MKLRLNESLIYLRRYNSVYCDMDKITNHLNHQITSTSGSNGRSFGPSSLLLTENDIHRISENKTVLLESCVHVTFNQYSMSMRR